MNIVAIITEYNPFHNGHAYQIREIKKILGNDTAVIAVMSGYFVQRGMPAHFDPWVRAELAVKGGVDLVLQLPTFYATASAQDFAKGAMTLIHELQVVDTLSFGSEYSLSALQPFTKFVKEHHAKIEHHIASQPIRGNSYPMKREIAVRDLGFQGMIPTAPNAILACEYLHHLGTLQPLLIRRSGAAYHDTNSTSKMASASAIRHEMLQGNTPWHALPTILHPTIQKIEQIDWRNDYYTALRSVIQHTDLYTLSRHRYVTEGLEHKLWKAAHFSNHLEDFIDQVKSKRFTQTRIQRAILSILLGITKDDTHITKKQSLKEISQKLAENDSPKVAQKTFPPIKEPLFIRPFGCSNKGRTILKMIAKKTSLPQFHTGNDWHRAQDFLELRATALYATIHQKNLTHYLSKKPYISDQ